MHKCFYKIKYSIFFKKSVLIFYSKFHLFFFNNTVKYFLVPFVFDNKIIVFENRVSIQAIRFIKICKIKLKIAMFNLLNLNKIFYIELQLSILCTCKIYCFIQRRTKKNVHRKFWNISY